MEALAVLGSALGIAALEALDSMVMKPQGLGSCLCPPLGATAVLCFAMAKAPASQPKNVIFGYLISSLVAAAVVAYLPHEYWFLSKILAVSGSIFGMILTNTLHPPGGAYAFLYVAQKMPPDAILAPGLAGAVVLVIMQKVLLAITGSGVPAFPDKTNKSE